MSSISYCADKHLDGFMTKIIEGIKDLEFKYPDMDKKVGSINSGMRGTKYYIEFPFAGTNSEAIQIITAA